VPDLQKLTIAQANDKLKSVKLELGKVNYQEGVPENQILDQYPHTGDLINEGATIDVWVARGGPGAPPANTP
jgi:beta-lactam-binding protein with PASTA domain